MRVFLVTLLLSLLTVTAAQDDGLCAMFSRYATGQAVKWNSAVYAFDDMPDDLEPLAYLPLNDPMWLPIDEQQAYYLQYSPSTGELWIYLYWSMAANADEHGDHTGNHKFCEPVKVIETR